MKNEKLKKSFTTRAKFFAFILCIWKRIYFAQKHSLGKCILCCYIPSKVFISVAGNLKQTNETPTSIKTYIGLVDVVR